MLSRMFDTELQPAVLDEEGFFFLDRSGEMFQYVLAHLRDPETLLLPTSRSELAKLKQEAHYYGLEELEAQVEKKLRQKTFTLSMSLGSFEEHCLGSCPCRGAVIAAEKPKRLMCSVVTVDSTEDAAAHKASTLESLLREMVTRCCDPLRADRVIREVKEKGFFSKLAPSDVSVEFIDAVGRYSYHHTDSLFEYVEREWGDYEEVQHYEYWLKLSLHSSQVTS